MLDTSLTKDIARRFMEPALGDLHPDVIATWTSRYPNPDLAAEMLDNPRLTDRILHDIAGDPLDLDEDDFATSPTLIPISALLSAGVERTARLAGMAWHRPTILDWVTWNTLRENAPGVSMDEARLAINAVSEPTRDAAGAPDSAEPGIDEEDILATGHRLIGMWRVSLPVKVAVRLKLFADTQSSRPHPVAEDFVNEVAIALLHAQAKAGDKDAH